MDRLRNPRLVPGHHVRREISIAIPSLLDGLVVAWDVPWIVMEGSGEGRFGDGAPYDNRYVIVFEVVDGRVRTVREYIDAQHAARLFAAATPQ